MIVSLREYADKVHMSPAVVRLACLAGRFKTATKIGSRWVIDDEEPYPADGRVTDGSHRDWRKRYPNREKHGE